MGKHKKLTSASSEGGRKTTATVGGLPESQPQKPAAKILSSNVQKLRFMKIAEHDREQRKLKLEQDEQDANIHWCLVGFEAEVKAAAKERSEQKKSANSTPIFTQARRSYQGMNKPIEDAMKEISKKIERRRQEGRQLDQATRLLDSRSS